MIQTIYNIVKAHSSTITANGINSPKGGPPGGDIKEISNQGPPGGSIYVISNDREPGTIDVNTSHSSQSGSPDGELTAKRVVGEGTEFTISLSTKNVQS